LHERSLLVRKAASRPDIPDAEALSLLDKTISERRELARVSRRFDSALHASAAA
jgi:hypothetical protein